MNVGNFNIVLKNVDGVEILEPRRDRWVAEIVEELLEEEIGPCPGLIEFRISGDSLVLVQIYRSSDGDLVLMVEDCIRRRNVLALHEGD